MRTVSPHTFAAHQGGEEVEMAPLVHPPATACQLPKPWQSVGNERPYLFSDGSRQGIERLLSHLKTLSPFDEYGIEKIHPMKVDWFHCHEVQHPLSALESEVHTVNDERIRTARKTRRRRRDERT